MGAVMCTAMKRWMKAFSCIFSPRGGANAELVGYHSLKGSPILSISAIYTCLVVLN